MSNIGDNRLPELAASIIAAHEAVELNAKAMTERAIEAGHLLIEAKETVGHGRWLPFLKDHVGIHERTAQRYMALAKSGVKYDTVSDLAIAGALAGEKFAQGIRANPDTINNPQTKAEREARDALVMSFELFGWVDCEGIVIDERGVVIAGHRRIAVAKLSGVTIPESEIRRRRFGSGDEADKERLRVAIASNIGFLNLDERDMQHIGKVLKLDGAPVREMLAAVMQHIGKVLKLDGAPVRVASGRPKKSLPDENTFQPTASRPPL